MEEGQWCHNGGGQAVGGEAAHVEAVELALSSPVLRSLTLNSGSRGLLGATPLAVEADGLKVAPALAVGTGVLGGLALPAALLH